MSDSSEEFKIEGIRAKRILKGGKVQYFIKWLNYSSDENTWEPEENVANARELIDEFNTRNKQKTPPKQLPLLQKGYEPEKVIGVATDENNSLKILIKYKDREEMEFVTNELAREHCPHLLIEFYERHIVFHSSSLNN